jgi:hypothetical protein
LVLPILDIEEDEEVFRVAAIVNQHGIKPIDSLHIVCAIKVGMTIF